MDEIIGIEPIDTKSVEKTESDSIKSIPKEIDIVEVYRLYYEDLLSFRKIAEHFGFKSRDRISRIFKEQNWVARPFAGKEYSEYSPEMEGMHKMESSRIEQEFELLKEIENPTPSDIAKIVENLHTSTMKSRVIWTDLSPYRRHESELFNKITGIFKERNSEVGEILNSSKGEDSSNILRFGVVDDKLYIRIQDTSERNWMNIYKNEIFHFNSTEYKFQLINEMKSRLSVHTNTSLGVLIDQLTDRDLDLGNGLSDLRKRNNHLRGETLHLILDTTGHSLQDIQHMIEYIGQKSSGIYPNRGCITNPRFSTDPEVIDMMFAKLFGLGLSDGSLSKDSSEFVYWEKDIERMNIVIQHSKDFGDVYHSEPEIEGGTLRIRFSCVLGRALERRGFPVGDKCVLNIGLPEFIRKGSLQTKCVYFSNLWPEDGNFTIEVNRSNRGRFKWDRSVVLSDPSKGEEYGHIPQVTRKHIQFIREYGKYREDKTGARITLSPKEFDRYIKSENPSVSSLAKELKTIVLNNPPNLLLDEIETLRTVGVAAKEYFRTLKLHVDSSRISSGWGGDIFRKIDVMRTAILMPPDDFRKRAIVEKWIRMNPEIEEEVRKELTGTRM